MQELNLPLSEINNMSQQRVYEYVIILSEIGKMRNDKIEAARNG